MNSLTDAKLDLVIASVVSMGSWCGYKKPSKKECVEVGVDDGKFYGGWKGKFGLNLQAICDAKCQFTYISLIFSLWPIDGGRRSTSRVLPVW